MTVQQDIDERLLEEALAWHDALGRDDADWDDYTLWLEADPRHRLAFDRVALTERIVEDRIDEVRRLRAIEPRSAQVGSSSRRAWIFGSMAAGAAAVALAVGVPLLRQTPDTVYATGRGETRHLALGQGVSIDLAPSTRLVEKGGDATALELAHGEAYFVVTHDPGRQLAIEAGDHTVTDIGTTFGVNLSAHSVSVAVADGTVSVIPAKGDATTVGAGQRLFARRDGGAARVVSVASGDVGSWRRGRLVYNETPLGVVAADISRYSDKAVTVDPAIRDRPFSGVLAIGDGKRLLENLSALTGLPYEVRGDSARIGTAAGH